MSRRGKRKTLLSSDPLSASYYVQDELWSPSTMTSTTTTTTSTTTTTAATTTSTKSDIDICLRSFLQEAEEDFVYFSRLTSLSATSRRAIFLDINEDEICSVEAAPRLCRTINLVRETIDLTSLEKNPPKWRWQSSAAGHHKSNLPLSTTVDITNILDGQKGGKYYIRRDSSTRHYHKRKKRKTVKMFQPIGRQLLSKYLAKNRIRKVIFRYIRNIKCDAYFYR